MHSSPRSLPYNTIFFVRIKYTAGALLHIPNKTIIDIVNLKSNVVEDSVRNFLNF